MCPLCDDTGWKSIDDHGVRRVVRCDCWRDRTASDRLARALIPARYRSCTLETFRPYNESLRAAVAKAGRFVDDYPVVDRGLLLLGLAGVDHALRQFRRQLSWARVAEGKRGKSIQISCSQAAA